MLKLTDIAINKIKEIAEFEGISTLAIRVKILGGGCAGFTQDMTFDTIINSDDEIIEQDDIKIIVDQMSIQYLDGTIIDYIEDKYQSGFKFLNPNVKGSCGCNSSVSF